MTEIKTNCSYMETKPNELSCSVQADAASNFSGSSFSKIHLEEFHSSFCAPFGILESFSVKIFSKSSEIALLCLLPFLFSRGHLPESCL